MCRSRLPMLLVALTVFSAGSLQDRSCSGQITISPSSCRVCIGDSIFVSNQSVRLLFATVCINGNESVLGPVAPGGVQVWPVPDDIDLVGLCIEIKLYDINGILIKKEMKIELCLDPFLGDVNLDGMVDLLDVAPFVEIIDHKKYVEQGDMDFDGDVEIDDLGYFIEGLINNP